MIGYLWYEKDDKKELDKIIKEGMDHFEKKYNVKIKTCFVNYATTHDVIVVNNITLIPVISIMPKHYYFVENEIKL